MFFLILPNHDAGSVTNETESLSPFILARLGQQAVRQGWTLAKIIYRYQVQYSEWALRDEMSVLYHLKNIRLHLYNTKIHIIPN